jgi:hypothetical protein
MCTLHDTSTETDIQAASFAILIHGSNLCDRMRMNTLFLNVEINEICLSLFYTIVLDEIDVIRELDPSEICFISIQIEKDPFH